jgi:hypothetical protein
MTAQPSVLETLDRLIASSIAVDCEWGAESLSDIRTRIAALVEACKEMQARSHLSIATKERRSMSVPERQFIAVCDALRAVGR